MNLMALVFLVLALIGMGQGSVNFDVGEWGLSILSVLLAMKLQYEGNLEKQAPKRRVPRVWEEPVK